MYTRFHHMRNRMQLCTLFFFALPFVFLLFELQRQIRRTNWSINIHVYTPTDKNLRQSFYFLRPVIANVNLEPMHIYLVIFVHPKEVHYSCLYVQTCMCMYLLCCCESNKHSPQTNENIQWYISIYTYNIWYMYMGKQIYM